MIKNAIPPWVWLFLITLVIYGAIVLSRAWRKRFVRFGPIIYNRDEGPITFWFLVAAFVVAEIILVGLLVGAIVATIWGPILNVERMGSESISGGRENRPESLFTLTPFFPEHHTPIACAPLEAA
jgi:hypothetical protein